MYKTGRCFSKLFINISRIKILCYKNLVLECASNWRKEISDEEMKNFDILCIFLTIRLCSVYLVQTFFVPDEYWQSLEVAHRISFGYGYLTWEWKEGIRSYIYPLIISCFYTVLKIFNLDEAVFLVINTFFCIYF